MKVFNKELAEAIGNRISELRGALPAKELAKRADIQPSQLSRYVQGNAVPSWPVLERLAKALGCTVDDIAAPAQSRAVEGAEVSGLMQGHDVDAEAKRVGAQIAALRAGRELSQAGLAGASGLPVQHLIWYEGGSQAPGFEAVQALARGLGVEPWEINGRVGGYPDGRLIEETGEPPAREAGQEDKAAPMPGVAELVAGAGDKKVGLEGQLMATLQEALAEIRRLRAERDELARRLNHQLNLPLPGSEDGEE